MVRCVVLLQLDMPCFVLFFNISMGDLPLPEQKCKSGLDDGNRGMLGAGQGAEKEEGLLQQGYKITIFLYS